MYYTLNVCGNCKNASFHPGFLITNFEFKDGRREGICQECYDWFERRADMYELRDELKNAAQLTKKEVTIARRWVMCPEHGRQMAAHVPGLSTEATCIECL